MSKAIWTQAFPPKPKLVKKRRGYRMSAKRRKESRVYARLRALHLKVIPQCQRCGAPATCIHHRSGRRSNYLKVETWRSSCNACNLWAKVDPKAARAEGWIAPVGVYLT